LGGLLNTIKEKTMDEYKLQINGKWQSFTVPQMVQKIYAAQQSMHWTAIGWASLGFAVGIVVGCILYAG
jgi:hypothetical protein